LRQPFERKTPMEALVEKILWLTVGLLLCYLLLHILLLAGQEEESQLQKLIGSRIERIRELRQKIIAKKRRRC